MVYCGDRATDQYQAIPVAAQASPLHPGGVIDLQRRYGGVDLRWTAQRKLGAGQLEMVAGLAYDALARRPPRLAELHRSRARACAARCGATSRTE